MDEGPQLIKIADFGSSEPWVARTEMTMLDFFPLLQLPASVKFLPPEKIVPAFEAHKDQATGLAMAIAEELGHSFIDLRRLQKANGQLPTAIETSKAYRDIYGHLWVAYKSRLQALMKFLGYDIGFIFDKDNRLKQKGADFLAVHPDIDPGLVDRVREDKETWQKALRNYRDDGEHNFTKPVFTGHTMHDARTAEVIFSNVWHAIEDVFIACMSEEIGKQMTIFEIPKSDRNPAVPKKYSVGFQLDTKTGKIRSRP